MSSGNGEKKRLKAVMPVGTKAGDNLPKEAQDGDDTRGAILGGLREPLESYSSPR